MHTELDLAYVGSVQWFQRSEIMNDRCGVKHRRTVTKLQFLVVEVWQSLATCPFAGTEDSWLNDVCRYVGELFAQCWQRFSRSECRPKFFLGREAIDGIAHLSWQSEEIK